MNRLHSLAFVFASFIIFSSVSAQTWPIEMRLSPDGRMLTIGGAQTEGFYADDSIRNVYLDFTQANYWNQLTANYQSKTDLPATMTVNGTIYDSVGVRFKGQTSYNQVSTQKKSFNISMDYIHSNQDIMGYETLNLNNGFLDKSFIREVFYQHQIRKHIPSIKSNFVHLYINNEDWGLYPNVQQLNKKYLKEWFLTNDGVHWRADAPTSGGGGGGPQWGDGTAALNNLGSDTISYQQYYTLESSDVADPWTLLAEACIALDTVSSANMENFLNDYIDIDRALWFLASEIAFTDDDGYVYKGKMDYNVYYEAETGRITPIEYDGNTCMDPSHVTTWSPFYHADDEDYPLLYRMLAVPTIRQRYLAHMRTLIADEMNPDSCNALIDEYAARIDALVNNDPKKIYTYNQFLSEITVLKNFIVSRRNFLLSNTEVAQIGPSVSNAVYYSNNVAWNQPDNMQDVWVKANVTSTNGIDHVTLYYSNNIVGKFSKALMYDDGAHNDDASGDGVFGGTIPGQAYDSWVRFYVEAASANTAKTVTYLPAGAEHNVFIYQVKSVVNDLVAVGNESSLTLYPNPASNKLNYSFESPGELSSVEILNVTGQVLSHMTPSANNLIDVSSLASGLYFVSFIEENGTRHNARFVKQ